MRSGVQTLEPFYGRPEGFSFARAVQPILDQSCVSCHNDRHAPQINIPRIAASASRVHEDYNVMRHAFAALSDGRKPSGSNDMQSPRFTWRGGSESEWVQYTFDETRCVDGVEVYWLDDRPRSQSYRVPSSWQLLYRDGDDWKPVANPSAYKTKRDTFNTVAFDAIQTDALRLVVRFESGHAAGILGWNVLPNIPESESDHDNSLRAFSLLGELNEDTIAKRYWSDAYLALIGPTNAYRAPMEGFVQWVHPQFSPSLLPPYHTGAIKSPMMKMLRDGHHDVTLSSREKQILALWIDLGVPFAGDYVEANAWSESEMQKYLHFLNKRRHMEAVERDNIQELIENLIEW
jgi:hypothetical protein